jgi:hypothetical protein
VVYGRGVIVVVRLCIVGQWLLIYSGPNIGHQLGLFPGHKYRPPQNNNRKPRASFPHITAQAWYWDSGVGRTLKIELKKISGISILVLTV